jgi:Undecaprenyl-phosphate galactose phosphotransferase WbaP
MAAWLAVADLTALFFAGYISIMIRLWVGGAFTNPYPYFELAPFLFLFFFAYAATGLYPGIGVSPVEEIRRLTYATSAMMVAVTAILFLTQQGVDYSRLIFLIFWAITLFAIPLNRLLARRVGLGLGIWGEPVALVGYGEQGKKVLASLKRERLSGLLPVLIIDGETDSEQSSAVDGKLPVLQAKELVKDKLILQQMGIQTAVLVQREIPEELRELIVNEDEFGLRRLILISNLSWMSWMGGSAVVPLDLQGVLGLEIERNLLIPRKRMLKRIIDLGLAIAGSVVVLPIILVCSFLIAVDTRGSIFYSQERVGKRGRLIKVWKFRTMIPDAERILNEYLMENPEMREEWEASHKLKQDPRITRVGAFLRKTSLDELPQLWNVFLGEMSLVGPRPIVQDEINHYKDSYRLYTQVLPGITGMWQVSGRSDTSYDYRVELDEYYIRHWSTWLDIYILLRTVWTVLIRSGAY